MTPAPSAAWPVLLVGLAAMLVVPIADGTGIVLTDPSPPSSPPEDVQLEPGAAHHPASSRPLQAAEESEPSSVSSSSTDVTLEGRELEVTRAGQALLAPFDHGGTKAVARLHQYGTVAAMTPDGDQLWERQSRSLKEAWGAGGGIIVSRIYMGPVADPLRTYHDWTAASPVAVHDLTDDGIEDLLVVHNLVRADRPDVYAAVSLLDGSNGDMLWFKLYHGVVTGIAFTGDTLVIAEENGDPLWDPDGRRHSIGEFGGSSAIHGITFQSSQAGISATTAWRLDRPGSTWARWTGPVAAGPGVAAVAHTPEGSGRSTVIAVDAATGQALWGSQRVGVVDFIRYDQDRDEVVFTQTAPEADVRTDNLGVGLSLGGTYLSGSGHGFSLVAVDAGDATQRLAVPVQHTGSAQQLALGDVTGDDWDDWVVSSQPIPGPTFGDTSFTSRPPPPARSTVTVLDGETGLPLWQRTTGAHGVAGPGSQAEGLLPPTPVNISGAYGLAIADGKVAVASVSANHVWVDNRHLQVLEGSSGNLAWARTGPEALSPASLLVGDGEGGPRLLGVSTEGVYRAYALTDGATQVSEALLTDPKTAIVTDTTGDGINELILGSLSGGVFSLNATPIPAEDPTVYWQADLDGSVHQLTLADVTGDGSTEIVAAAEHEVAVLDAATGTPLVRLPYPHAYVWSVTIADIDGDGLQDLVVPTDTLDAYRGHDGAHLWRSEAPVPIPGATTTFSNAAVSDGTVVAQVAVSWRPGTDHVVNVAEGAEASPTLPTYQGGQILGVDLGTGEEIWSREVPQDEARVALWRSVAAVPSWPATEGPAVAVVTHPGTDPMGMATATLGMSGETHPGSLIRVLDADTGADIGAPFGVDVFRMGFTSLATDRLIALTNDGLFDVTPGGLEDLPYRHWAYWGVDLGAFGAAGDLIAAAPIHTAMLVEPDAFQTGQPPVADRLGTVDLGQAIAGDLDGDGVDEVIAFGEDDQLYSTLEGMTGRFYRSVDVEIKGVAVMDVSLDEPAVDG